MSQVKWHKIKEPELTDRQTVLLTKLQKTAALLREKTAELQALVKGEQK